jgi:ribonuclease HII
MPSKGFMTTRFDRSLLPAEPSIDFEYELWQAGARHVAGIDEAGRGPLAGPVAAAAVILPNNPSLKTTLRGVRDSKQMTPGQREYWADRLKDVAVAYGIGFASAEEIDAAGILPATYLAVRRALAELAVQPDHLLLDYLTLPGCALPQTSLVKGDARCLSIAAASVLAKTARDRLLCEMDRLYPGYGFARHKGYGTPEHLSALRRLGPCPIHRLTFRPIKPVETSVG